MKSEHGPEDVKTFNKGANSDQSKELLGSQNTGEYIDALNARPVSVVGNTGAIEKIKGEEILYPNTNLGPNYICIGCHFVNTRLVEYWASPTGGQFPAIRIDGEVMVKSSNLTFNVNFPLQFDKNESCREGEVFLTDNNSVPLIFDIKDIIDNFNGSSNKYFTDFNISLYQVNLSTPLDIPVFIDLVNTGGGGGLPVGEYSYAIRYVNTAGDRTNWGNQTPLIPVFQSTGISSAQYPYVKTVGSDANNMIKTSYGPKIRFRVTNLLNYDSIEIRRYSWNSGILQFTPSGMIVGRIGISPGEISVKEFIDPMDSNIQEVIPDDEDVNELLFIEKAKCIRYFDKRLNLMHYSLADKQMAATFEELTGKKMFPIIKKLGKPGHNDPYNHTYYKNYQSGERYGFAITGYDGVAGKGFAVPIGVDSNGTNFADYQFPNRREPIVASSEEDIYSYEGAATAADKNGVVNKTFEAFDLVDAIQKSDVCSFRNIYNVGNLEDPTNLKGAAGTKFKNDDVQKDCAGAPEANGGIQGNFLTGTALKIKAPYNPYTPVRQSGTAEGHNYRVNTHVGAQSNAFDVVTTDEGYNPTGYAPNYYSKGIALSGVDGLPSWVKSFTVGRTRKAGRVICQGLGMYSLNQADFQAIGNLSLATKNLNKMWFFSQDIASGLVNQSIIDDININPSNYKIQFISPLGYFSELYNFKRDVGAGRDMLNELMVYSRVLHDSGEINPSESGVGVGDYVGFNKYRNTDAINGGFFGGSDGDKEIGITSMTSITEGRGSYFELLLDSTIYNNFGTGGTGKNDFADAGARNFHEPFYIINIIQDGANIINQNVDNYLNTGAYVKVESIIGIGDGTTNPSYQLVDERWEDCIPALSSGSTLAANDRFVYLKDSNSNLKAYINVTYKTLLQINTIKNDIITNGFYLSGSTQVYGVYTHAQDSKNRFFNIVFNVAGYDTIAAGLQIVVKYDKRAPISVFGGDSFVGESIFSPIDRSAKGEDSQTEKDKQFAMDVAFPFRHYHVTPRHYILNDTKSINAIVPGFEAIQPSYIPLIGTRIYGRLAYLRQMSVMFTAENNIALHTAYSTQYPNQFFPGIHYVMRPNKFDDAHFSGGASATYDDNNLYSQYKDDYGDEYLNWTYGGIRFLPQHNIDYSQTSPLEFVSKPDFGFVEENEFCTGIIWSLPRAVNQQDSPGLKTFQSLNTFIISDDQGGIVRAWDATSEKGDNLYALCQRGVCLLLTNKAILSDLNSDQLGVFKGSGYIQGEYWLDKKVGINDEMWRSCYETSITVPVGNNLTQKLESILWVNSLSAYKLANNQISDISGKYYSKLSPVLSNLLPGFTGRAASFYDEKHNLYGVQLQYDASVVPGVPDLREVLFVYNVKEDQFVGRYDYRFDNYMNNQKGIVFGCRDGETHELNKGFVINGSNIRFEVEQASSLAPDKEKEFIKINVNSNNKPTDIEFYNDSKTLLATLNQATQGALYLKNYDGWQQQIPRKDLAVSATRNRIQDRLLIYKIIHTLAEDFKVTTSVVQFKLIK